MKSILSLSDIPEWSSELIKGLSQLDSARVIMLSGDLGAGKTTVTQSIGVVLGITEPMTSPTFVIQKEYQISDHAWIKKLVHIDAYRLEQKHDLEYLGWNELITEPETLVVIEWPEMVSGISLPEKYIHIHISINEDYSRTITKYN